MENDFNLEKYYKMLKEGYASEEVQQYFLGESIELVGWHDHIAEFADVRTEHNLGTNDDGDPIVQHNRFDGTVFQEGTPVNAENLGRMEWNDLINATKIQKMLDIVKDMQVQVATLVGQNNNNMPYNSFVASAKNIGTDLDIIEGWYDEANGRGAV
nr:MAG TPA: hypothetical protein [Caudoviricetes sp.]